MPRILALEPWNAGSHRSVVDSINAHGRCDWTWLTRPGGGVRWCLRQSALGFAEEVGELHEGGARWDAVLVSSLCSLSDFRACAPPEVRALPHVLYMHENQAAYPVSERVDQRTRDRDAHLAFTNLASVEAADRVLFNSEYNRDSFVEAMTELLSKAPWSVGTAWSERVLRKSRVAWPPVPSDAWESKVLHNLDDARYADDVGSTRRVVRVAWPHRWEHDKGCGELNELISRCKSDMEYEFRWTILGRRFTDAPAVMAEIEREHHDVIDRFGGPDDRQEYLDLLRDCDWVTSTARHEFFGIAVVEAIACGCLPWLPDRLSYPELVPKELRGLSPWSNGIDIAYVREVLLNHLDGARETRAVEQIEQELLDVVAASRSNRRVIERRS